MLGRPSILSGAVMYLPCCMRRKPDPCLFVQIDLRYTSPEEGGLEVVVAPVMRFKDIEFNANVKIEEIAPPERIISGFALEIFGAPLQVCLYLSLSWIKHTQWKAARFSVLSRCMCGQHLLMAGSESKSMIRRLAHTTHSMYRKKMYYSKKLNLRMV